MRSEYHDLYVREETEILYNQDDEALSGKNGEHAICIKLPTVESFFNLPWDEAIQLIDGYGLPPNKQKYDTYRNKGYYLVPHKLEGLGDVIRQKRKLKDTDSQALYPEDYFDEIESDPLAFRDEIAWMKVQIKRAHQGYWCFINGKPTYIDGWHYTYLNYWKIENDKRADRLPFFRDVDRRIFLFYKWAYTTREAVFKYKIEYRKNNKVTVKYFNNRQNVDIFCRREKIGVSERILEEGKYIVERPHRTVFGVVFPKRRRVGATFMGSHVGYRIAVDNSMGTFAIQALTEQTAKDDVYTGKVMKPFGHYPFFLKPSHGAHTASKLTFMPRSKKSLGSDITEHGGWIIPRSSANKAFDGNKLWAYLNDESGKKEDSNVLHEFRDTIKNALAQGDNVHGFAFYTSTFGEFERGGGKEYFELCKSSISHKRNDNGFTQTGLVTLFVPAYDGYDGHVDEFGYSIIDDPDLPYRNMEGEIKTQGAKSVLTETRRFLEEMKDWEGYNTEVRSNPFNIGEASARASRSNFWDINILRDQVANLRFVETTKTREVDLEWSSGFMSPVNVVPPVEGTRGKFTISYLPPDDFRSKIDFDEYEGQYRPSMAHAGKFVLGTDPFSFDNEDTTGKKKSNGGGAVFYKLDAVADGLLEQKISECFVCTYNTRPETTDEYSEDMLKLAVLYNAHVMTERNVPHILKKFREWNATGYLLRMRNPLTNELEKVAGVRTTPELKQRLFAKIGDYIKANGRREVHLELLEQVLEAQSFADMTDLDLFTAAGMALLGAESDYVDNLKNDKRDIDGNQFIEEYD